MKCHHLGLEWMRFDPDSRLPELVKIVENAPVEFIEVGTYAAMLAYVPGQWEGYSSASQTASGSHRRCPTSASPGSSHCPGGVASWPFATRHPR